MEISDVLHFVSTAWSFIGLFFRRRFIEISKILNNKYYGT